VPIKGFPLQVFADRGTVGLSDLFIDLGEYNGLIVDCYVVGTLPDIRLTIEGNSAPGGNYLPIPDPKGRRVWIRESTSFMVVVGARFAKARITSISGTGTAITVILTPFMHPGGDFPIPITVWASNSDDAVLNLGTMNIWTPSPSGTRFRVLAGILSASVAGAYLLRDSANTISSLILGANQPFPFDYSPNGYLSSAIDNALNIRNVTGSTAAIRCSAWGMQEA